MAELRAFEGERLLSLLPRGLPFKSECRLVYAHDLFIRPEDRRALILTFESLEYLPSLESYVALAAEGEALTLWQQWANQLLDSARRILLSGRSADLGLATAMRARYCTVPAGLRVLRKETFTLAFAFLAVLGRPTEPLIDDAKMDFSKDEITVIEQEGTALAAERAEGDVGRRASPAAFLTHDLDLKAVRGGPPRAEVQVP